MALTGWEVSWGWRGEPYCEYQALPYRRSCFSEETPISLSNYHSQARRMGQPSECSVPGKVLARMLLDVQERQGCGGSQLGSPVACSTRSA